MNRTLKKIITFSNLSLVLMASFISNTHANKNCEAFDKKTVRFANRENNFESLIITLTHKQSKKSNAIDFIYSICNDVFVEELTEKSSSLLLHNNNKSLINIENYKKIYKIDFSNNESLSKEDLISLLSNRKEVESVSEELIFDSCYSISDPYYVNDMQWGIDKIQLQQAYNYTIPNNIVNVGVIDNGVDGSHSDLVDIMNGSQQINLTKNGESLGSYYDYNTEVPHGTHISGIIAAKANNSGIFGVCQNARITSINTYLNDNSLSMTSSLFIRGISSAIANNISIINFSFSLNLSQNSSEISQIINAINNSNALIVCSAGNNNLDLGNQNLYPAKLSLDNVITVGASDENDVKWSLSNYGDEVDIFAPGTNIYSCGRNNSYLSLSGTSMSAPFVTGVAALAKSINPNLTAAEIKNLIISNGDEVSGLSNYCSSSKRLNALKVVQELIHSHSYDYSYSTVNLTKHKAYCSCGDYRLEGHVVPSTWNGSGTTNCLLCGGKASMGFRPFKLIKKVVTFGNGSYIAPNGIVFITDEDLQLYYKGLLSIPNLEANYEG